MGMAVSGIRSHTLRITATFGKGREEEDLSWGTYLAIEHREGNPPVRKPELVKELGLGNLVTTRQSGPALLEVMLSYITVPSRERPGE